MKVLTFGELMLRLSSPGHSRLFQRDRLETLFCGSEANVAVSLAQFGISSKYITKLPSNDIGLAAARSLAYYGVDTSDVLYGDGRMGIYYLESGASQRSSKVIYDRAFSAVSLADPSEYDWERLFTGVDWFHTSGITPAISNNAAAATLTAVKAANKLGITVSCDLNYRAKLWTPEQAQRVMGELMPYVDICIANEEDAGKMLNITAEGSDFERGFVSAESYKTVARQISDCYGCSYVGVTLRESFSASHNGWSGLLYRADTCDVTQSRKYDISIVDRVGAGDSFTAGLIWALLNGDSSSQAVEFATAASCLKHSIEGDFNRVSVAEVQALVAGDSSGRVRR